MLKKKPQEKHVEGKTMQIIKFKTGTVAIVSNIAEAKEACFECFNDLYENRPNLLLGSFIQPEETLERFEKNMKNCEESIEKTKYILQALEEENVDNSNYLVIELKDALRKFIRNRDFIKKRIERHNEIKQMHEKQEFAKETIYEFVKEYFIDGIIEDDNIKVYE